MSDTPDPKADDGTPFTYLTVQARTPANGLPLARPGDILVRLSNGAALGGVQSVTWHAEIGEPISCTLRTIMSPADIMVQTKDLQLQLVLSLRDNPFRVLWAYACYRVRRLFSCSQP